MEYNSSQLRAAAARAKKDGNTEAEQELLALAETASMSRDKKFQGGLGKFSQGLTLGAGDEINAALMVPTRLAVEAVQNLRGNRDGFTGLSDSYSQNLSDIREVHSEFGEKHPVASVGLEVAGALTPAISSRGTSLGSTAGNIAKNAPSLARQAGIGAVLGAGAGGAYGFNTGEGDLENRLENAGQDALMGAAFGAAAPALTQGVTSVVRRFAPNATRGVDRAKNFVLDRIRSSGDDVSALQAKINNAIGDGADGYALVDAMGERGRRALSGVARADSDVGDLVTEVLDARQSGQRGRVMDALADSFGDETADEMGRRVRAARRAKSNDLYEAAAENAKPVKLGDLKGFLDDKLELADDISLKQADSTDRLLSDFRSRLFSDQGSTVDYKRALRIKQDLSLKLRNLRKGGGAVHPDLTAFEGMLDKALEESSEGYRAANAFYREQSGVLDAIGEGQKAGRGRGRSQDIAAQLEAMSPDQRAAFGAGVGDSLAASVEKAGDSAFSARPLTNPRAQKLLDELASDPASLKRRIGLEKDMLDTRFKVTGGSRTADNLADITAVSGEDIASVGRGDITGILSKLGAKGLARMRGLTPEARQEVARIMLSQNPQKELAEALQRVSSVADKAKIASLFSGVTGAQLYGQ